MDSALDEFSKHGYGASSINNVCGAQDISKGIIYHYFDTKDALFLACVGECFELLTGHILAKMNTEQGTVEQQLERYFTVRTDFFNEHPVYRRIFCEAVITPPGHLIDKIKELRREFDALNIEILERLLAPVPLRSDITKAEVMEVFREFQDFINAQFHMKDIDAQEFENREKSCLKALSILLYGIIERREF